MSASTIQLDHLSTMLNKTGNLRQHRPLSENNLREFYGTIASDRIHLSRQDWQGHCVSTLIGHLPNLKPAVKTSLSRFVVGRWNAQAAGNTATLSLSSPDMSGPSARHAKDERLAVSQLGEGSGIPPQRPFVSPAMPALRRDWFDRFTDWVAALVSLFK